ncbi:MAG: Periplasmic beta-glucosidase precursor [Verrucomicrobiota bacterium]
MKKSFLILATFAVATRSYAQTDAELEKLLRSLTLEEKVGQMSQITLEHIAVKGSSPIKLDDAKLREAILTNHVGSFLNTGVDHALTLDEWNYVFTNVQGVVAQTDKKIPLIHGIDSIHGATYVIGSTIFPQNISMAATRNPDLMRRAAEISAAETRAAGIRWSFSPDLDVGRQPLWPRFNETFGEDPFLASVMGATVVKSFQGTNLAASGMAACAKHYMAYSLPFSGRDRSPALMPDWYLREYFLPPFRDAVKAGARTIMANSGEVNGEAVHASHYLLTEILRGELGFDGVIVSDWEDVMHLESWHGAAATKKDAARIAVEAGIDMSMIPTEYSFPHDLAELVREGKVSEKRINESVRRILKLKRDVGLLKNPLPDAAKRADWNRPEYKTVALQAAEESIVLLKNDGDLPLAKSAKILVCGPAADSLSALHGSWSYTWQGHETKYFPADTLTIRRALEEKLDATNVTFHRGVDFSGKGIDLDDTLNDATNADAIVVCLGEDSYAEAVGDIEDLNLPRGQQDLARKLAATGKPVILVLAEGRPRIVRELVPQARAILWAGNPASQGARALANILFGDANPSGKLAFTYPKAANNLVTYDRKFMDRRAENEPPAGFKKGDLSPQWEFGFGLSYTKFEFNNLKLSSPVLKRDGKLAVTVDVTNTGKLNGAEVAELYTHDLVASLTPPGKRLRAFQKVWLQPGETKTLTFTLTAKDLAFINRQSKTVTEPGEFKLMIDRLGAEFRYDE